ncbi:hypothetical protein AAFF_G00346860 [Aldrovandia affinis]|uniref:BTB domain-containing protein n=1 Tax=Aldrovandia affinis TaxID=143900 RepID=A0AAD7SK93_9TELE|nr:hypothetical protein AAFF_G00346860 [Aldrovandia affinis]
MATQLKEMESLVHYTNPAHALALLDVLNEQRLKGQLCDVVLIVGDQKLQAHRSVLAASSEYFLSLFARRGAEACTVVQLDFCEPDALENVLNYLYTSSLFVDKQSMAAIQELGYSLGIPYLTGIMLKKPHVSYSISTKRTSFPEGADFGYLKRTAVMCQSLPDKPGTGSHIKILNPQEGATEKHTPAMKGQRDFDRYSRCWYRASDDHIQHQMGICSQRRRTNADDRQKRSTHKKSVA